MFIFSFIPPVPLAVKKIGVYYDVKKTSTDYEGYHLTGSWKIWQNGSQDFYYRTGDKVHILLSIFSPTDFKDHIFLKWSHEDENGKIVVHDRIPLEIRGGREKGFRGYGTKQNVLPGNWTVDVESADGRILRSIDIHVIPDKDLTDRNYKKDIF